ncbi:MAG: signal peptidase I [Clostridia bacterium]|nr:signal peptidase I [Clostridia bacterium]
MKSMSPKAKKTGKIIADVAFWIFFVFALAFTVLAFTAKASAVNGFPQIGDKTLLTVETDSMKGPNGFNAGDLIISRVIKDNDEEIAKLKVGDVITFRHTLDTGNTIFVDHRIIDIAPQGDTKYYFTTHGDNNPDGVNETTSSDKVYAVWTGQQVPGLGGFIHFLQPPQWGFFVFIIIPLAGFLGYEIVVLVLNIKQIRNKDKKLITAADEELIKQKAIEEFLKQQEAEKAAQDKSSDNK